MTISAVDLTADIARARRDQLAGRIGVLDKVGVLRMLPDEMHATTEQVATFYEVDVDAIRQAVKRNRDELDEDGYRVIGRAEFERDIASLSNLDPKVRSIGLYPRRAVLRLGMLLRDSDVARRARDYLLNTESDARPAPLTDDEIIHRALEVSARRIEALKSEVAELKPKAELADNYLTAQGGARLVRQVAKTFGMKEADFRRFLLDEGLIYVRHSQCGDVQYDHYAQFAHHFLPRETVVQHQWGSCSHYTLMILPRGVELIAKRLRGLGS